MTKPETLIITNACIFLERYLTLVLVLAQLPELPLRLPAFLPRLKRFFL